MAIYSKAQEILWNKPESLAGKVTMRIGGMHHLMAFIASIGKLFGDGGLMQLLTVIGVYANDTTCLMLQGKQIVRAVRGIKLVLEALSHLYLTSAEAWAKSEGVVWQDRDTKNDIDDLQRTFRAKDMQSSTTTLTHLNISITAHVLHRFQSVGRSQSATFIF